MRFRTKLKPKTINRRDAVSNVGHGISYSVRQRIVVYTNTKAVRVRAKRRDWTRWPGFIVERVLASEAGEKESNFRFQRFAYRSVEESDRVFGDFRFAPSIWAPSSNSTYDTRKTSSAHPRIPFIPR